MIAIGAFLVIFGNFALISILFGGIIMGDWSETPELLLLGAIVGVIGAAITVLI